MELFTNAQQLIFFDGLNLHVDQITSNVLSNVINNQNHIPILKALGIEIQFQFRIQFVGI